MSCFSVLVTSISHSAVTLCTIYLAIPDEIILTMGSTFDIYNYDTSPDFFFEGFRPVKNSFLLVTNMFFMLKKLLWQKKESNFIVNKPRA